LIIAKDKLLSTYDFLTKKKEKNYKVVAAEEQRTGKQ
jgi:hypothetical protein